MRYRVGIGAALAACVWLSDNLVAQGPWTPIASMNYDRYWASGATIDGTLFVVSGQTIFAGGGTTTTLEIYDPATNQWTLKTTGPLSTGESHAAAIGTNLFVVGGCINANCGSTISDLQEHDSVGDTWTLRQPMSVARHSTAVGVVDGKLYVSGGFDGSFIPLGLLESFDPQTGMWTALAPMPTPRALAAYGVIDGILHVAGGHTDSFTNVVEAYDPRTDTWTTKSPMPEGRYSGAAAVVDGILYVMGGATPSEQFGTTSVIAYDPILDAWFSVAPMTDVRFGFVAAAANGVIYAAGGANYRTGSAEPLSSAERFAPPPLPYTRISVDVKPGSSENTVTLQGSGVIPVAMLSTSTFDAPATIDPSTLQLDGASVRIAGRTNNWLCLAQDVNADGQADLVCHFDNELDAQPGDSSALVTGTTFGGAPLRGRDTIRIVP